MEIGFYRPQYTNAGSPVFTDLTFTVNRGERIALHGENGCGKSTLLKMILQKSGHALSAMPVIENGVCETAAGLVISDIGIEIAHLKNTVKWAHHR